MTDQFIGQVLAGKYRIDSELRASGSGKIYRGTHLLMEKPVSIKILAPALAADEGAVRNFSAEARAVSRISHPNILNVTDFGSDINGTVYTILEGADGETLNQAIAREGKFPLNRAVRIAWQIAAALSAAHAAGLVHGRLNADNILLAQTPDNSETVKILDFGTVAQAKNQPLAGAADLKNLEYLSPEQNASASEVDERSDVYALGVILYEMLAGEVPFRAENAADLITKQAENPPMPLSAFRKDLPEDIELVVLKALAKNPEMRYQTGNEFANALNRASNNAGDIQQTVLVAGADNTTNNLWKTAFVVLAGISLLAVGLIYATSVKQTNIQTQLQTDANGQPVQPLNPATGMSEQGLANMAAVYPSAMMTNINGTMTMPQPVPNGDGYGDGYNPWASGKPPAGAPTYVAPGGQVITIPGDGSSQFMPAPDGNGGYILVPQPMNTNANAQPQPSPKPGKTPPNANTTATPAPSPNTQKPPPTDAKTTPTPAPSPKTEKTPAKPAPTLKPTAPASGVKPPASGKEQDS